MGRERLDCCIHRSCGDGCTYQASVLIKKQKLATFVARFFRFVNSTGTCMHHVLSHASVELQPNNQKNDLNILCTMSPGRSDLSVTIEQL